jgi:hypothetical protein
VEADIGIAAGVRFNSCDQTALSPEPGHEQIIHRGSLPERQAPIDPFDQACGWRDESSLPVYERRPSLREPPQSARRQPSRSPSRPHPRSP